MHKSLPNWRFIVHSSGQQDFCVYRDKNPVSEPVVKTSAFLQATGEAKYTQDVSHQTHHLNGVYILNLGKNAKPYAKFEIDIPDNTFKEKFPDVVRVFTAKDMEDPNGKLKNDVHPRNHMGLGPIVSHGKDLVHMHGDTVFAQDEVRQKKKSILNYSSLSLPVYSCLQVYYIGQPLGMVVAKTQEAAREAAEWLQDHAVFYDPLDHPGIVTLDEAIEKNEYLDDPPSAEPRLLKVGWLCSTHA